MSYPWWRFKVKYQDGFETEWSNTEMTVLYAMHALLDELLSATWKMPDDETAREMKKEAKEHGDVVGIEYLYCETYGVDKKSDAILSSVLALRGERGYLDE